MRTSLCTIAVLLSASVIASSPRPQQSANSNPQKAAFVDPCANAATDADKKACWTEAARRAKFFLDADSCEAHPNQSDEERDNCKMDRAKQATARLDAYYRSIQKGLRADLAKGKAAKWNDSALLTELQKTQAAWSRYRDLECETQTTPYDGGTVTISIKAGCEREKAEARLKELHDTYARYLRSN
ncbi:MAG TPA: lysozyme inhibitor LprI family protein [Candidatus Acidoferrum sp.]|nr:lysozyme inhibitor LprI family protein [Candidatus Acidoferrum sp.]